MENILLKYLESDITTHPTGSEGVDKKESEER